VLEEVSPRLNRELVHPDRSETLAGIRFSPDGRRVISGSYPEGVIQVWDASSGRPLVKIESGYETRGTDEYFLVSPDWSTVYVSREKRIPHKIEKAGKKLTRWEYEGDIRAWDLATGELRSVFRQSPMRGIIRMALSPDGQTLMVGERLPGETEGREQLAVSLLDVQTGKFRELPGSLSMVGGFSPDSRLLAIAESDDESYAPAIQLFDVASGQVRRSLPILEQPASTGRQVFSPDGQLLAFVQHVFPQRGDWKNKRGTLKFISVSSGLEFASFAFDEKDEFGGAGLFSPDGRTLSVGGWRGGQAQILLFDVAGRKLAHTVTLHEGRAFMRPKLFRPDGRWLAVATQFIPPELQQESELPPEEIEQPRIHLVEVATGKIRETFVSPQTYCTSGCFSPDGKTLATSGNGRVLLWDLSDLTD
jgi:WD40 repeat protein